MKQIITYAPHIILIQEHQLSRVRLREFRKMMTMKGYQLINYAQSIKTYRKGRGSGGLATWIKTTVLNEYRFTTLENTAYIQTTKLKPLQPHINPPIIVTNTYCKPLCGKQTLTRHMEKIQQLHRSEEKQIEIILGDLNARMLATGDHKRNAEGESLRQFADKHKLHLLNESLAYNQYTSTNINNGESIIDVAIIPQEQKIQWETLEVIPTPRLHNTAAHNTIVATSYNTIQTTRIPSSHKYSINYNDFDAYCLRQQLRNKVEKTQTKILNKVKSRIPQENTPYTTKILETIQYCMYGIHHLTSLNLYGLRRVNIKPNNQLTITECNTQLEEILGDPRKSAIDKIEEILPLLQSMKTKGDNHKQQEQLQENTLDCFRKWSRYKQNQATDYPKAIKPHDGKEYPPEIGFANYFSKDLMKPITDEMPSVHKTRDMQQEQESPISTLSIQQTIKNLKKNKTPGITAIPINYYKAGGVPMSNMLTEWYETLEYYQIVPWNLKVDIKVPIPKYQPGAHRLIKQDPSNYRPLALQNCMYKILDGCLKIKLERHNEMNRIIYPNQGGFKKQEGTTEQLFVMQNLFQYNEKLYCAFLDLKKAYDTV